MREITANLQGFHQNDRHARIQPRHRDLASSLPGCYGPGPGRLGHPQAPPGLPALQGSSDDGAGRARRDDLAIKQIAGLVGLHPGEPAWTLLTFDSLRALRQEPSAIQTAIRIANDLNADEIAGSAVARNTLILLRQATERGGLPVTATGK